MEIFLGTKSGISTGNHLQFISEIPNLRKETSRHLNSEELNLICGTSNETKWANIRYFNGYRYRHDLLKNKLSSIFEMVDAKGLIVRLVSTSVPSQFSMEESECISAEVGLAKNKFVNISRLWNRNEKPWLKGCFVVVW